MSSRLRSSGRVALEKEKETPVQLVFASVLLRSLVSQCKADQSWLKDSRPVTRHVPRGQGGAHVGARRLSVGRGTCGILGRPGTCGQSDPCTRLRPVIFAHADWRHTPAKLAWQGPAPWDHFDCRVYTPHGQDFFLLWFAGLSWIEVGGRMTR